MNYEDILQIAPYSLDKEQKNKLLTERLLELTKHHKKNCSEYSQILDSIGFDIDKTKSYQELPFLPVRMFKELELKSIPGEGMQLLVNGTMINKRRKMHFLLLYLKHNIKKNPNSNLTLF